MILCGHLTAHTMHLVSPTVRSYACMVNDATNDRMILFGGGNYRQYEGELFNDVWSFDSDDETWNPVRPSGQAPAARVWAGAAYDQTGNRVIFFGGGDAAYVQYNDVYALSLTAGSESWTQLSTTGTTPSPRTSATVIIDEMNYRMVVFGGEAGSGGMNTVWVLDLSTLNWSQLFPSGTPPEPRFGHSAIYDGVGQRMIVFGGQNTSIYNDTWSLSLSPGTETWQQLTPTGTQPGERVRHFCVYDNTNHDMVVGFGFAYPGYYVLYSDIWTLDLSSLSWQQIYFTGCAVQGRRGAVGAYSTNHQSLVVFGGDQPYASYFGETYILDMDYVSIMENEPPAVSAHPSITVLQNPATIPFEVNVFVPYFSNIDLQIYDIAGRTVRTLIEDRPVAGNCILYWDGKDDHGRQTPSGTYIVKLQANGLSVTEKAVVIE
jgi:N-acetylneuraminic acid mutarotase